ncbi:hypothetical protein BC830DRAFT_1175324 [Chytriomyces sp. MP71]|nr:hypothetical protein BC830DRAFT_1175324 [Chytriomyces sp. MP71]
MSNDRGAEIAAAQAQVIELQQKKDVLLPAQEELRAKRAVNEIELQKTMLRKQELILELTQLSATYEAEQAIHAENLAVLEREKASLAQAQVDVEQAKQIVAGKLDEKKQVLSAIEAVNSEILDCQKSLLDMDRLTRQYQEETTSLRPHFAEVHAELKKQLNMVEINKQLLATVTEEYQQLKGDVARDETLLDSERKKAMQLSSQVSVQTAINEKERAKAQTAMMSLSEAKSLSNSHAMSLASLEAEAATGFLPTATQPTANASSPVAGSPVNISQKLESSVTVKGTLASRPKPPPPPASRNPNASTELLGDKRKSVTASVKSNEPVVDAAGPPPLPPSSTKPKTGNSTGDLITVQSPTTSAQFETNFDADFESAFTSVAVNNQASIEDAFAGLSSTVSKAAIDDAFGVSSSAAASQNAFDSAFASVSAGPKNAEPSLDAFTLPKPPSTARTGSFADAFGTARSGSPAAYFSDSDFDKFKRPSLTTSIGDSGSIRSAGRKRMTVMKKMDLEAEFANAFGSPPSAATSDPAPPVPFPAVAATTSNAADDIFNALPASNFNLNDAFTASELPSLGATATPATTATAPAQASVSLDVFADLDNAFDAIGDTSQSASGPQASETIIDASFDAAFEFGVPVAETSPGTTDNVDTLEAAFGSSPTQVSAVLAAPAILTEDFDTAFVAAVAAQTIADRPINVELTKATVASVNVSGLLPESTSIESASLVARTAKVNGIALSLNEKSKNIEATISSGDQIKSSEPSHVLADTPMNIKAKLLYLDLYLL